MHSARCYCRAKHRRRAILIMKAIDKLKELALEKARIKYPNVPPYALTIHDYTDKTANGLTRCIIDWINFNDGQAERISNTGRFVVGVKIGMDVIGRKRAVGSNKWIKGTGTNGTADISAIIKGKNGYPISWKIEVKIGKDRQSEAQQAYQLKIEQVGGVYSIVKDFDMFYAKYIELYG